VDQRWCVECGTRRGPVAPAMQALIAGTAHADAAVMSAPDLEAAFAEPAVDPHAGHGFALPSPRAAAVAISAILGFGVIVGSVVSPSAVGMAEPIVVAVAPPAPAPAAAPAPVEEEAPVNDTVVDDAAPVEAAPEQQIIYVTEPQQTTPTAPTPPPALPVPPMPPIPSVSHVFLVMLTSHGYDAAFGANSQAPYLSKTLTTHGELIPNYYGIAHGGLANEIALISGQSPTKATAANCPELGDVTPGTPTDGGQVTGDGCVYPTDVKTIADQLATGGNTWKVYAEGAEPGGCDPKTDKYKAWRNPFLFFHSLTDNAALCNPSVADLSQLDTDLAQVGDTPGLVYIVPNKCHDGSDTDCGADQPKGLAAADAWLQTIIPKIEASPGYTQGGLIAITFDAAPKDGPEADSTACCGQPETYPNLPADDPSQQPDPNAPAPSDQPTAGTARASQFGGNGDSGGGTTTTPAPTDTTTTPTPAPGPPPTRASGGGGKVGLLLISPYIKPNTVNDTGYYNHFGLFASIEDMFAVGGIAYANLPDLTRFDKTVYTAYNQPTATGSRAKR
jgi:phosphatidylinositol-3-phosphatase